MSSYSYRDQTITEDTLEAVCLEAIIGSPIVPMALSPMDGAQWLCGLIDELEGHPLGPALDQTLTKLLRTVSARDMDVLANVVGTRPGHVPDHDVLAALDRAAEASEAARSSLARVVRDAVLEDRLPYRTELRIHGSQADTRDWLAGAFLCKDHAWTMQQLSSWFTGDADHDGRLLGRMSGPLTRGELVAFEEEATAPDSGLAAAITDLISRHVARVSVLAYFADRGDSVRWRLSGSTGSAP